MTSHETYAHHFDSAEHEFESGKLGMWAFLLTEVLFFSGLFCLFAVYRAKHPAVFEAGKGYLDVSLGTVNTIVLITSSLTIAWAVRCAQLGQRKGLIGCIAATLAGAFVFLGIKAVEYSHKWHDGLFPGSLWSHTGSDVENLQMFFGIYFSMTGLHAIHVIIGIAVMVWILVRAMRGTISPQSYGSVEYVALYWHLVDLVWIYLFPLLYLL